MIVKLFHEMKSGKIIYTYVPRLLLHTVVPWYLLIRSDEWRASAEWWSVVSCGVASWFIQVLASVMSGKQTRSGETFFLIKMQQVPSLTRSEADKHWGTTVFDYSISLKFLCLSGTWPNCSLGYLKEIHHWTLLNDSDIERD